MSRKEFTTATGGKGHLSNSERKIIGDHLRRGTNKAAIARLPGRDKSTIKREIMRGAVRQIKRNTYVSKKPEVPEFLEYKAYFADAGQRAYEENRRNCGSRSKIIKCLKIAASGEMERRGRTKVYYAHPYSSFERGTNGSWNGIVRRFIPKGSGFEDLDGDAVKRIAYYINTMPRKRFGYKTPLQLWEQEIAALPAA